MKEKYVEERWPELMDFGKHPDGRVGVVTVDDRVDLLMSPADAQELIREWNRMQHALTRCAMAFSRAAPEAFSNFWYGSELEQIRK